MWHDSLDRHPRRTVSSEGKSSQWAELQAVYLVVHFAWKEKWPNIPINGLWPMVWLDGQSLRENMMDKWVIKKFGKEVCG